MHNLEMLSSNLILKSIDKAELDIRTFFQKYNFLISYINIRTFFVI